MRVGERAKVLELKRPVPSHEDRSAHVGQEGLVVRRLNVPWDPETGELWELKMDSGETVVFSANELAVVRDGRAIPLEMDALKESWGDAPRVPSQPFKRFGAGVSVAPAVLALLVFALAAVLLIWAGVASGNWALGAAGGALLVIGIGAAGVLIL